MPHQRPRLLGLLIALLTFWHGTVKAAYDLNMPKGVSSLSGDIYQLHMIILWICVVIGILVYSIMLYAIVAHRKSKGHKPATFHESTTIEIVWTIIPFLILLVMAVPATKTLILMDDTRNPELTIKITGYRWYWQYEYLDEEISFFSNLSTPESELQNFSPKNPHYLLEVDNPLVIPVGKKVRFLVTAKDVIHSWWVPDLGLKKDAVPGFINEIWTVVKTDKPGIYRGQCAELCGAKHGFMPIVVEAKTEQDYLAWVKKQKIGKETHA